MMERLRLYWLRVRLILQGLADLAEGNKVTFPAAPSHSNQVQQGQVPLEYSAGQIDRVKEKHIEIAGILGPYLFGFILGFGNSYFFSGFRMLTWDLWTLLAYMTGFGLEWISITTLFKASQYMANGQRKAFWGAMCLVVLFALVSVITQYLMVLDQLQTLGIRAGSNAIEQVPLFQLLLGATGLGASAGFVALRAIALHLGEITCVILVPSSKPDVAKTLQKQREYNMQQALVRQEEAYQKLLLAGTEQYQDFMQESIVHAMNEAQQYAKRAARPTTSSLIPMRPDSSGNGATKPFMFKDIT